MMKTSIILNPFVAAMLGIGSWSCSANDAVAADDQIAALQQAYRTQRNAMASPSWGGRRPVAARAWRRSARFQGAQKRSAATVAAGRTPDPFTCGCATLHRRDRVHPLQFIHQS
ncbi:hypothetical protein [Xanthomonas theicola]|uniref:hypothetical protein n=1 Tax=Xanthomonas theicola TaxID=56464 RepID=UPI000FF88781|nr:hypothetical protein [Xanthomonas theicola]QNH25860.1 hypothetical protein G4Q83_15370 [Xanthomonas theicola]